MFMAFLAWMTLRAWRDRECGCLALETFVGQRAWEEIFPFLEDLWNAGKKNR